MADAFSATPLPDQFPPDGQDIFAKLRDDVSAFLPEAAIAFGRVAITPSQITEHALPTVPLKPTRDHIRLARYERWCANGYGETCQVEALPPDLLAEIVEDAVAAHTELNLLNEIKQGEREARQWLRGEFRHPLG